LRPSFFAFCFSSTSFFFFCVFFFFLLLPSSSEDDEEDEDEEEEEEEEEDDDDEEEDEEESESEDDSSSNSCAAVADRPDAGSGTLTGGGFGCVRRCSRSSSLIPKRHSSANGDTPSEWSSTRIKRRRILSR